MRHVGCALASNYFLSVDNLEELRTWDFVLCSFMRATAPFSLAHVSTASAHAWFATSWLANAQALQKTTCAAQGKRRQEHAGLMSPVAAVAACACAAPAAAAAPCPGTAAGRACSSHTAPPAPAPAAPPQCTPPWLCGGSV